MEILNVLYEGFLANPLLILYLIPIALLLYVIISMVSTFLFPNTFKFFHPDPTYKCIVCSQKTTRQLYQNTSKLVGNFCSTHLLEKYSEYVLKGTFNIVMIDLPRPLEEYAEWSYFYCPISEYNELAWSADERKIAEKMLSSINSNSCEVCSNNATVLFISRGEINWNKYNNAKLYSDYIGKGKYLCRRHALEKVSPRLKEFAGSIYAPNKEEGYQLIAEI